MKSQKSTSFIVFIIVISIVGMVFLTTYLFSYFQVDKKYAMILAFFMFIALAFTTVGIYTGITFKSENQKDKIKNRIGLWGNMLIFVFTILVMAFAAFSKGS